MDKSDRDISEWDARLKEQLERGFHNYHKRRIDLSVARENKLLNWTGETLIVEKASSDTASATVRLNFDDADELTLEENVEIKSIFGRVYLSNDAQADEWLDVIAGINFEYKKKIAEAEAEAGGLPKTGQTISYQDGDDGYYEAGWNTRDRFTNQIIAGDDIVLDNATGLMWARDGNAAGGNNGGLINWANGIIYANELTFASFSDWRLPNIAELFSIVDFSKTGPAVWTIFTNTASGEYWSSTTYIADTLKAVMINFAAGNIGFETKINNNYIRCVRKGL